MNVEKVPKMIPKRPQGSQKAKKIPISVCMNALTKKQLDTSDTFVLRNTILQKR